MVNIDYIIKLNRKFGGTLLNKHNLDFDIQMANQENNIYKSNAYIIRGIIAGHPFSDGNKRTALTIISKRFNKYGITCNEEKLTKGIISIAKNNITNIDNISKRLRKWCRKY